MLKPLPLVIKIIGRRGKRNAIIKPKVKYVTGANNDIPHHNPLSRFNVASTLSIPSEISSLEMVYANLK